MALIVSCDSRNTVTGPPEGTTPPPPPVGSDNVSPLLDVSLATGNTGADTIVYIGGKTGVVITASDNLGLATLSTTMRTATGSRVVDSVTYNPTVGGVSRTYTIDVATIARGDRLVFTSVARDASANPAFDSLKIVVADTATPVVTVASKVVAASVKGLDSIDVAILATDAAGIDSAGVKLVHVRGPGDTVTVFSRSAKPTVRTTSYGLDMGFRISDTLPIGQYLLIPFGADKSGLSARNVIPFGFQLNDATRPTITLINPTSAAHVAVGDSIFVNAQLADNAGLARVTFSALSWSGDPALGTQDTVVRYTSITAPTSGAFPSGTRSINIQRFLKALPPTALAYDSLIIRAIVTDGSGNSTQLDLKIAVVPTLSIASTSLNTTLKNRDTLRVRVTAGDTSGVRWYGYSLQRSGDSTAVRRDSVVTTGTTYSATNLFAFVLPDSLQPGTYTLSAFSRVLSPIGGRTATAGTLSIADGVAPTIAMTTPLPGGRQSVGDSMYVVVDLHDNVGLSSVSFRAYSVRGDSALGTRVQVDRYTPLTVGSIPAGTRDLNVQRYMKATADSMGDSVIVVATVTDVSGMTQTVRATLQMVPGLNITSPAIGTTLKNRDTLRVRVSAGDATGVTYYGYSLLRSGDATPIRRDSVLPPAGTYSQANQFTFVLPDSLQPGTYTLSAFSKVQSAIGGRTAVGGNFSLVDGVAPSIVMTAPDSLLLQTVGDSLHLVVDLRDNVGVSSVAFRAYSVRGDSTTGTQVQVERYSAMTVGGFAAGTRFVNVQRFLKAITTPKVDSTADVLTVVATVTDVTGLVTTLQRKIQMQNGPRVNITVLPADSVNRDDTVSITVNALSNIGVQTLGVTTTDNFPTSVSPVPDHTVSPASQPNTVTSWTFKVYVPANAVGTLTITGRGADINGQRGASSPYTIAVRTGAAPPPLVHQQVDSRVEIVDSVLVTASGKALRSVGYSVFDLATGTRVDSNSRAIAASTFGPAKIAFSLPTTYQGKKVSIMTFAVDSANRIGYSVPSASSVPITDPTLARRDTMLVVYGRTFALPAGRPNAIADVFVDTLRGNVFLSNIQAGRLEVFQENSTSFTPNGIIVGSQPWGMTMSRFGARDTLYVANSGGTNLSRVYVGGAPATMLEDVQKRLKTRISFLYKITEVRDPATNKIRMTVSAPISFSDRPQYVEQSVGGRLYISTKPTSAAPVGTVRYVDPAAAAPDERFILAFAGTGSDPNSYLVANVDYATVHPSGAASLESDTLYICDHPTGTVDPQTCRSSTGGVGATVSLLRAAINTDLEVAANADETSLGLTDTTFVTTSGDGKWIAFGEGNKRPYARVMLLRDDNSVPGTYTYAAPAMYEQDLVNNASDVLFGLALDKTGQTLGVHGTESYFAFVDQPFTQRLQGKKSTFSSGSGIAFHPGADGINTNERERLAFVASNNGTIEMVDIAHYDFNRGTIVTKANFYGPIRAITPSAAEQAAGVRVKLYGMSTNGLVIINVNEADILPGQP